MESTKDCQAIAQERRAGAMKTNLSGKLNISVELEGAGAVAVKLIKK